MVRGPEREHVPPEIRKDESMAGTKSKAENPAPEDEGWETVQEESPAVLVFENPGDRFIGRYLGPEHIEPTGTDKDGNPLEPFDRFTFRAQDNGAEIPDGTLVAINSSWRMNSAMDKVQPGDLCRITYVKPIKTNQPSPLKDFRVDVKR